MIQSGAEQMRMPVMSPGVHGTVPAFRTKPCGLLGHVEIQTCVLANATLYSQYYISLYHYIHKLCFNLIPSLQKQRDLGEAFLLRVAVALFSDPQITRKKPHCDQLYH